jgi:hypothetical protein
MIDEPNIAVAAALSRRAGDAASPERGDYSDTVSIDA